MPRTTAGVGGLARGRTTNVGALDPVPGSKTIVTVVGGWKKQVIAVSHDDGKTWKVFDGNAQQPNTADDYRFIAYHPQRPGTIYAGRWANGGQSNGVFRSVDFGMTWESITYDLGPEMTAWSVAVSPHDGTVFLGTSHGTWTLAR